MYVKFLWFKSKHNSLVCSWRRPLGQNVLQLVVNWFCYVLLTIGWPTNTTESITITTLPNNTSQVDKEVCIGKLLSLPMHSGLYHRIYYCSKKIPSNMYIRSQMSNRYAEFCTYVRIVHTYVWTVHTHNCKTRSDHAAVHVCICHKISSLIDV